MGSTVVVLRPGRCSNTMAILTNRFVFVMYYSLSSKMADTSHSSDTKLRTYANPTLAKRRTNHTKATIRLYKNPVGYKVWDKGLPVPGEGGLSLHC